MPWDPESLTNAAAHANWRTGSSKRQSLASRSHWLPDPPTARAVSE